MTGRLPADEFSDFVVAHESRLRHALTAAYGSELGREASADALAYGWQHWQRIRVMGNPVGYLYRVGQSSASRRLRRGSFPVEVPLERADIAFEPGLPAAMSHLSERQRVVVTLIHGFDWSFGEVAALLGISKGAVQTYELRAMKALRRELKVTS